MIKRPLIPVALAYLGGLLLANFTEASLPALFFVALAFGIIALVSARLRPFLLLPFIFFAGWANLNSRTAVLSPHDLRNLIGDRHELVQVRATLAETPSRRVFERHAKESWHTLALVNISAIRIKHGAWQPAIGSVMTTTAGVLPGNLFDGRTVLITGVLGEPPGPLADGLFDYRTCLRRQGIYHQLKIESDHDWEITGPPMNPPLAARFSDWAQTVLARGLPAEDEALRLQWAMVLGWKTALTDEVSEPFMRSGTMHIFAISGLHIALIAGILVALFRLLNVPRAACGVAVIPLIWFYTAATGWQPSAIRSTVMMTIIITGWSLQRPSDLLNSLCAAACIILVWDPQQLFQASFQLSFFVVLSIALLMPALEKWQNKIFRTDPLLPRELRPRWQRRLGWAINAISTSLATSLAAFLGSMPIIAFYFHLFTPVSLFANLLIVPVSGLALMCGLGSVVAGDWFPRATEMFNHSGWFFMSLMVQLSEWATALPGGYVYITAPGLTLFFLYYLALLTIFNGWLARPRLRWWCGTGIVLLSVCWGVERWHDRALTEVTVLPLNGGHAIFINAPGHENDWLINCGDDSSVDFDLKPFLRAQGVNRLAHVILTHHDQRMTGGAETLDQLFHVRQFITGRTHLPATRSFRARLEHPPSRWQTVMSGDPLDAWEVLHPDARDKFPQSDDHALVLRREINGLRLLLLSDLGVPGQNALLARHADLRADIVVTGLPKEGEPLSHALLAAIQPRLIIVADSAHPATRRAGQALRARLSADPIPVIFTHDTGATTLALRPGKSEVRVMNGTPPQWR